MNQSQPTLESVPTSRPTTVARRRKDRGFTLIELLIVIAILGILSTIVVLSVRGIQELEVGRGLIVVLHDQLDLHRAGLGQGEREVDVSRYPTMHEVDGRSMLDDVPRSDATHTGPIGDGALECVAPAMYDGVRKLD